MTYDEILNLAVYQSGSMGSDEGLPDLENDAQLMIKQYVDEAYLIITRDYYKPFTYEQVTLDENGTIDPSTLSKPLNEIVAVSSTLKGLEQGYGQRAVYDPLNIAYVPISRNAVGEPGSKIWVKYTYLYPPLNTFTSANVPDQYFPLVTDGDIQIPAQYHSLLADYATYRFMSTGNADKQNRAQFFYIRWLDGVSKIKQYGVNTYQTNHFRNLWTR